MKDLLKYLNIKFHKKTSHNVLIKKLLYIWKKYNSLLEKKELEKCRNEEDIFTGIEIKHIPREKLVLINEMNCKYDCFDVIQLRKYLFVPKTKIYLNPFTRTEINENDVNKILNVDIKLIYYFCQ